MRGLALACLLLMAAVGWLALRVHGSAFHVQTLEADRIVLSQFGTIVQHRDPATPPELELGYSESHKGYGLYLEGADGAASLTMAGRPSLRLGVGPREDGSPRAHEVILGQSPYVGSAVNPLGIQVIERGATRIAIGPSQGEPHISLLDRVGGQYLVDIRPQGERGGKLSVHGLPAGESDRAYPSRAVTISGDPKIELTDDAGETMSPGR
ncbi:MAG: hypothetical protein R3F05_20200 [Planctomycetota bacterium]